MGKNQLSMEASVIRALHRLSRAGTLTTLMVAFVVTMALRRCAFDQPRLVEVPRLGREDHPYQPVTGLHDVAVRLEPIRAAVDVVLDHRGGVFVMWVAGFEDVGMMPADPGALHQESPAGAFDSSGVRKVTMLVGRLRLGPA